MFSFEFVSLLDKFKYVKRISFRFSFGCCFSSRLHLTSRDPVVKQNFDQMNIVQDEREINGDNPFGSQAQRFTITISRLLDYVFWIGIMW